MPIFLFLSALAIAWHCLCSPIDGSTQTTQQMTPQVQIVQPQAAMLVVLQTPNINGLAKKKARTNSRKLTVEVNRMNLC